MSLVTIHRWPTLERPVLVLGLDGWIDAGYGAATATSALLAGMPNEVLATFSSDELIDHRARRPMMRLSDGVNTGLTWPEIELRYSLRPASSLSPTSGPASTGGPEATTIGGPGFSSGPLEATTIGGETNTSGLSIASSGLSIASRSVLVLTGPEPDLRWHQFTAEVVGLAARLGVTEVFGLGAFPAPVPHTRPVRLASTASTPELAAEVGFVPGVMDVPAGIQASLEDGFKSAGVAVVGLWARVPHYVSAMPYPAASAALLDQLARMAGIEIDREGLQAAARQTHTQIDQLIANSDEHSAMVRQLEAQDDEEVSARASDFTNLPSGDEIAAELERFLRGDHQ